MSRFTLHEWIQQIETEIAASKVHNHFFRKEIANGTVSGIKIEMIEKGIQKLEWLKELQRYKDLEEAGRLIELDDSLPARDELDRCTHRHCNNCDKYRRELKHYKDLADEGRLIELPCKVGDTENCKMYTMFRAEIDAMYSQPVLNECDEVFEIMRDTQQIGLLCLKDKYIQGLYILPEYRNMGHGKRAVFDYVEKHGMPKDLTILNTNYSAINFWNSIFELEILKSNPIDTYYKIKALKGTTQEETEAKLEEMEGK